MDEDRRGRARTRTDKNEDENGREKERTRTMTDEDGREWTRTRTDEDGRGRTRMSEDGREWTRTDENGRERTRTEEDEDDLRFFYLMIPLSSFRLYPSARLSLSETCAQIFRCFFVDLQTL